MSDGEDEDIIAGDEDFEEEEEAITTMMDTSGVASLDDILTTPPAPCPAILDSMITVDTWMTTAKRQPSPTS